MSRRVLVLMSGGLDSSVLAADYLDKGWEVEGLFIDYNQPWIIERVNAEQVAKHLNVILHKTLTHHLPVLDDFFVPMRNAHLLTIAVAFARLWRIPNVAIGSTKGEFLDQTGEFIDRFNFMTDYCFSGKHPWVLAPFCGWSKDRVMKRALALVLPVELTRSCMEDLPCGVCGSCKVRAKYGFL